MDWGSTTQEDDDWYFNPFECLYLLFAEPILSRLDWNTQRCLSGTQLRIMETPAEMAQEVRSDGTCLPATTRMEACEAMVPPRTSSQFRTPVADNVADAEQLYRPFLQTDGPCDAMSTVIQLQLEAATKHNKHTMAINGERHILKSPETCPCNACVFLRDPAYFPPELKNANIITTASNGVAPPAQPRSPAPVPNGKPTSPMEMPQSVASTDPKIAAQQASDMRNIVRRKLTGYVGFANLPNQWHRKSVRKGFNFNVMVVGEFR